MTVHKYNNEYAKKNGVNGTFEFLMAIFIGVIGSLIPAILLGSGVINFTIALIIWIVTILFCIYFLKRYGIINKSTMSVLIEDGDDLIYMMITPNLEGSMFPKSFFDLLAGPSATFVGNKLEAEVTSSSAAQNESLVDALFNYYKKNPVKSSFNTLMYGKPVYFSKLLNKDFGKGFKKIYTVEWIKENGQKSKVKIPNVYPTFFEK